MNNAKSQYEIEIKTAAQLTAAENVAKTLTNLIAIIKQMGGATEALEAQLKGVTSSIATASAASKALSKSAEEAEKALKEIAEANKEVEKGNRAVSSTTKEAAKDIAAKTVKDKEAAKAAKDAADKNGGAIAKLKELAEAYKKAGGGVAGFIAVLTGGGAKAIAAATGIASALFGIKKAVDEFAQAEMEVAGLTAALAQSQQLTTANVTAVQAMANSLQNLTAIPAGQWLLSLNKGIQFGAKVEELDEFANGVKNLAGALGVDIGTATTMMTKALQGSFQTFSQYGIVVKQAGTQTEKLNQLYRDLAQRGGGQLEAAAKTLAGQFKHLGNNVNDLLEAFGQQLAETGLLQAALYGLATTAGWLAGIIGKVIPPLEGFRNAAARSANTVEQAKAATEAFARAQIELAKATEQVNNALEKQLSHLKEVQRREDEKANAQMALELAQVEASNRTPEQKNLLSQQIRNRFAEQEHQRKVAAIEDEITVRNKMFDANQSAMQEADAKFDDEVAKAQDREAYESGRSAIIKSHQREIDNAKYKAEQVKMSRMAKGVASLLAMGDPATVQAFAMQERAAQEEVAKAEQAREAALSDFDKNHETAVAANLIQARQKLNETKEPLFQHSSQLLSENERARAELAHLGQTRGINRQLAAVNMSSAVGQMVGDGGAVGRGGADAGVAAKQTTEAIRQNGEAFLLAFREQATELARQKAEIERLRQMIQSDRSYHRNNRDL